MMERRSESAEVTPCAQQEPQYWGMCWFLSQVTMLVPSTSLQSQAAGMSSADRYSWGRGEVT
jgi:hypothetical protein